MEVFCLRPPGLRLVSQPGLMYRTAFPAQDLRPEPASAIPDLRRQGP